jgi:hypothetical protein
MKWDYILFVLAFSATAFAQSLEVVSPTHNQTVGNYFQLEIEQLVSYPAFISFHAP